jgi:hypothetical protein
VALRPNSGQIQENLERNREVQGETELVDRESLPSDESLFVRYGLLLNHRNSVGFGVFNLFPRLFFRSILSHRFCDELVPLHRVTWRVRVHRSQ